MDSSADLSGQILNSPELSQKLLDELVPIIYKGLQAAGTSMIRKRPELSDSDRSR